MGTSSLMGTSLYVWAPVFNPSLNAFLEVFWQRVTFASTRLPCTVPPRPSVLWTSTRLTNVVQVSRSINLYEGWGPVTLQNKPCLVELLNGRSLAELEETTKYEFGVFSFFLHACRGSAAATVGSPVGKYQQHYGVGLSLPSLSMRGRGLSERTKGEKTQSQTKNNARDGGKERGKKRERGEKQHVKKRGTDKGRD